MKTEVCTYCKRKPIWAKELCNTCYTRALKNKRSTGVFDPAYARNVTKTSECSFCGSSQIRAKGLCVRCYARAMLNKAKGNGFDPAYREREKKYINPEQAKNTYGNDEICISCGRYGVIARGLCGACYRKALRHKEFLPREIKKRKKATATQALVRQSTDD